MQWRLAKVLKHPAVLPRRAELPDAMTVTSPRIGTISEMELVLGTEQGRVVMQLTPDAFGWLAAAIAHQCAHPESVATQRLRKHRLAEGKLRTRTGLPQECTTAATAAANTAESEGDDRPQECTTATQQPGHQSGSPIAIMEMLGVKRARDAGA